MKSKNILKIMFKIVYGIGKAIVLGFLLVFALLVCLQRFSDNNISFFKYRLFSVVTGSMAPRYTIGDILLCKEVDVKTLKVGDDISYFGDYGSYKDKVITHRIIQIEKDDNGELLFYTKGIKIGTYTYAEYWDLSDLNNPVKLNGAKMADGGEIGYWNNADFAYDAINKRIYVIKEDHTASEWYPNSGGVNWISGSNSVFYAPMNFDDTYPGETLFGKHNWSKVTTIGEAQTGFARVHNAGIMTDEYGWLVDSHKIPVVYTMSDLKTDYPDWSLGGQWPALHTYRLHGYVISL